MSSADEEAEKALEEKDQRLAAALARDPKLRGEAKTFLRHVITAARRAENPPSIIAVRIGAELLVDTTVAEAMKA